VGAGGGVVGAAYVIGFSRYVFIHPHAGERWTAGQNAVVTWLGPERANLEWSPDDGRTWRALAANVGGRAQDTVRISVPAAAGKAVPLRLVAGRPRTLRLRSRPGSPSTPLAEVVAAAAQPRRPPRWMAAHTLARISRFLSVRFDAFRLL
jgi:hypothetical protein